MSKLLVLPLFALLTGSTLSAQPFMPRAPELEEPYLAWDRGDYPTALRGYLDVLNGPRGEALLSDIALLTGEWYSVTEVAPDGRALRMGPLGRYVTFEVPEGETVVTRVVEVGTPGKVVATLPGTGARLSPARKVAYLRVSDTEELRRARAEAEAARTARDRDAMRAAFATLRRLEAMNTGILVRDLVSGEEEVVGLGTWFPVGISYAPDNDILYVVAAEPGGDGMTELLEVRDGVATPISAGARLKADPVAVPGGRFLVFSVPVESPVGTGSPARTGDATPGVAVKDLVDGRTFFFAGGSDPTVSADGSTLAFVTAGADDSALEVVELRTSLTGGGLAARSVVRTPGPLAGPALSPDGRRVAFQARPRDDWEIFVAATDGSGNAVQVTKEIQHDLFPRWLDDGRVLAVKGEGRHRRSYVYDAGTGAATKLFHNNTVRTIAPEYEWVPTPDGKHLYIVAERDGDTVSPERGVYVLDFTRTVSRDGVRRRLEENLAAEEDLRRRGEEMFAPAAAEVRAAASEVSVDRIYEYARRLYVLDSKYITQPGNRLAIDYLVETLRGWGYEPEVQWFEPLPGVRTANVIVRVEGTVDPALVYVVSSHFDSSIRGPGADDDSSGTTALLEAARVLKSRPQAATIELAFFTGEEAGLLGSREYVRRAVAGGKRIVGALNNDMVGWANDQRLDNTVRYSNPGIRDIQHGAAIQFSDLITYDALYYKSTDAHAYYEVYGDIVGGIGSYPVLGNPHYHQVTDRLETVDQRLVAEVSRTTVATVMLLASSPSRLSGLKVRERPEGASAVWERGPESGIVRYQVRFRTRDGWEQVETDDDEIRVRGAFPGGEFWVRAVNRDGFVGWDWARATVPTR
ncbi:MAG: M20/M25/M40 family metallo-hydrolase [Gemmatimonadota bacterium]|nr:M20/M25/M40 family metallo-hydrolase [Gemmatimonadota bacterium]